MLNSPRGSTSTGRRGTTPLASVARTNSATGSRSTEIEAVEETGSAAAVAVTGDVGAAAKGVGTYSPELPEPAQAPADATSKSSDTRWATWNRVIPAS
jgi:hypothetical protein